MSVSLLFMRIQETYLSTYKGLVLFFCTFLALRAEDTANPLMSPVDTSLHHEKELYAGYGCLLFDYTNAKCCPGVLLTIISNTHYEFFGIKIAEASGWKLLC